jgi:hypothetical protein
MSRDNYLSNLVVIKVYEETLITNAIPFDII